MKSSSCYLVKRIDKFISPSLFAFRKWHPSLRALCCLWSSETTSGPSPFFVCVSGIQPARCRVCLTHPKIWPDFTAKQSVELSARVTLCFLVHPPALPLFPSRSDSSYTAAHLSSSYKLLDWVKTLNSCWWPTRCGLWTKNILRCQLPCLESVWDEVKLLLLLFYVICLLFFLRSSCFHYCFNFKV